MGLSSDYIIRRSVILAATTIIVASIWYFAVLPELEKMPSNFHLYMEQEGTDQIATNINGDLTAPFKLRESLIQKIVVNDGNYLTISSVVSGKNEFTDEEIFHADQTYNINVYDFTYKGEPQNSSGSSQE